MNVALAGGDVEGGAAVQVDAVGVNALVEKVLEATGVATAGHEEEVHGRVQVLRHRQLGVVLGGAPADGVQRRLPAEAEPEVGLPRVKRRLPRELPAQRPPQRSRRELPRYPPLQLRGDVFHFRCLSGFGSKERDSRCRNQQATAIGLGERRRSALKERAREGQK